MDRIKNQLFLQILTNKNPKISTKWLMNISYVNWLHSCSKDGSVGNFIAPSSIKKN